MLQICNVCLWRVKNFCLFIFGSSKCNVKLKKMCIFDTVFLLLLNLKKCRLKKRWELSCQLNIFEILFFIFETLLFIYEILFFIFEIFIFIYEKPCNINLPGYTFLHSLFLSVVDGVSVYFSNQLKFAINNQIGKSLQLYVQACKDLWFNITFPNLNLHYIFRVIYHHPHNNHTHFFNAHDETFQILNWKKSNIIIMGDININMLSDLTSPHFNHFNQILVSNGFTSSIIKLTRITKLSQTSIDHKITNVNGAKITPCVLQYSFSDHLPIFCIVFLVKPRTPLKTQPFVIAILRI